MTIGFILVICLDLTLLFSQMEKKLTDTAIKKQLLLQHTKVLQVMKKRQIYGYIKVLNVSKQKGAKPGMVNFKEVKTITVNLDFELVEKLRIK